MFEYAEKLINKLPETDKTKALQLIQKILEPQQCWETFLKPEEVAALEEADCEENGIDIPSGPLAMAQGDFNKATGMLLDLLVQLMAGKHLADCQALAAVPGGLKAALQSMDDGTDQKPVELLKHLRLLTAQFDAQGKSIAMSASVPEPSLLQQLTSTCASSAEEEAERARAWSRIQGERKKLISFSVPRTWSKDGLLQSFRSSQKVFTFQGSLNTSHRLILASADLFHEEGQEPWNGPCPPPIPAWREVVAFAAQSVVGPTDFIMLFDGRMREVRRIHVPCFGAWQSLFPRCIFVSKSGPEEVIP